MQTSIFEFLYPNFKINKPLRLIELFAGYGSQALALKYLGKEFEHHRICEWAVKSIQAYNDMHMRDYTDYSIGLDLDYLRGFLANKGISANYNEPMTRKAIDRLSEKQVRTIYNNIIATHNLVNIQQVHGDDLDISGDYIYMMTYSFPCQDLSLAGKAAGMSKGTGTRSGMLWEVERILKECTRLPDILVMENVPQVHSSDNISDFNEWQLFLENLGYNNYCQDLSATDYGIPQTRNRCFMVSLLGEFNYTFPQPQPLKIRLKDLLESDVDEKYFLSDKMIEYIISNNDKWTGNNDKSLINKTIASTINTAEGSRRCDASNYICDDLKDDCNIKEELNLYNLGLKQYNRRTGVVLSPEGAMTTLLARTQGDNSMIAIKNATKQGYLLAEDGDGIDVSTRMEYHRGTVQKGMCQTLTTADDRGVVVQDANTQTIHLKRGYSCEIKPEKEFTDDVDIIGNYSKSNYNQTSIVGKNGVAPTVTENHGQVTAISVEKPQVIAGIGGKKSNNGTQWYQQDRVYDDNIAISVTTECNPYYQNNLRIRKLTPRECFRLMGVRDEDFDHVAVNQSNASLYHLAGDSIVVNV